jgi:hypothetical protein
MIDSLTCPKCGADYSNKHIRPGIRALCSSCGAFSRLDGGVLTRLTAEEIAAIPEEEMAIYKSITEVFSGRIKNDYEDPNVP